MKVIIKKWGNSAAIRIPASIMAAAHIGLDQAVDVREEQGRIVIEPLRRKVYKLDELLSGITLKNQHQRVATGAPNGKAIITNGATSKFASLKKKAVSGWWMKICSTPQA